MQEAKEYIENQQKLGNKKTLEEALVYLQNQDVKEDNSENAPDIQAQINAQTTVVNGKRRIALIKIPPVAQDIESEAEIKQVFPILQQINISADVPKAQECNLECATNFQLQPHQCRVAQALQKQRGVIAIHAVGSGKTRLAVASAKCFLAANKNGLVIVITPNVSIKQNFEKQFIDLENLVPAIPDYSSFKERLFQGKSKSEPLAELKKSFETTISSNKKSIFVITNPIFFINNFFIIFVIFFITFNN